uniref:Hydroxysteroid (17-beta) dehydrogenase 2 n=1 Tax=Periophthalmus magnuspinnatus TaxID=409849 RepID=A0A3B3ZD72_9GOBI
MWLAGCDSGFGHGLALRLSGLGMQVFAGVLDSEGDGAKKLKEWDPERIAVLQMDVTNPEHIAQVKETINKRLGQKGLWGLVNNAGLLLCPVDAELQSTSSLRRLMEVNFLSAVTVTQTFLPLIRKAKGRVVGVSSLAGKSNNIPGVVCFIHTFEKSLMLQWGVHVAVIQPSGFKTSMELLIEPIMLILILLLLLLLTLRPLVVILRESTWPSSNHQAGTSMGPLKQSLILIMLLLATKQDMSPVLDCIEHALLSTHPRPLYCPGKSAWLLPFLYTHLPTATFDRFTVRVRNIQK